MSRQIDPNEPLTEFEVEYLRDRGRLPANYETAEGSDRVDDFDDWNVDRLKSALEERGMSTSGKKADLIARLRGESDDEEEFDAGE